MSAQGGPGVVAGRLTAPKAEIKGSAPNFARRAAAHKWERFLRAVLERPCTTRELQHAPVFDHVAHSTASELRKKGVALHTQIITINGYAGLPARVARYSIAPEGVEFARELLERR